MSYSNAIYYLDFVNGSDTARANFAGVASNPSGTTVLITSVGHGLVTGAVVVLSAFTAWLNGSWKITRVDADTFTLDDATWAATADPNGTVTPNGGMNWTDAWKTMTTGATAARIQPGDTIRIAKSPAPASIGTATWTDLSRAVTLSSAQTTTIDNCETAWTANAAGDSTVTRDATATDSKEGSYCMRITLDASPQINMLQAYFATGALNLSAYQKITFWLKNSSAIQDANRWAICLCSDVAGATVVDTFPIPAIPSTAQWVPLTITKSGGGNLGNNINSIAIYTGGTAPTASMYVRVDNFSACTTSGLNLQSLISKNSAEQGGIEPWHGLKSIDGVNLVLDNDVNSKSGAGKGYLGVTETVTTYARETIKTAMVGSADTQVTGFSLTDNGKPGVFITYSGGWNTATTTQDGETFYDGLNGFGYQFWARAWVKMEWISNTRYYYGIRLGNSGEAAGMFAENIRQNNCYVGLMIESPCRIVSLLSSNNCFYGITATQARLKTEIDYIGTLANHVYYPLHGLVGSRYYALNGIIRDFDVIGNCDGAVIYNGAGNYDWVISGDTIRNVPKLMETGSLASYGSVVYRNVTFSSVTSETIDAGFAMPWNSGAKLYLHNYNLTGYDKMSQRGLIVTSLATDRVGGTGKMWKMAISNSSYDSTYNAAAIPVARVAVNANKAVTVTAWVKKSHATNVGAKLVVRGKQLAGVASDITVAAADSTAWNQITLASFTPTEAGVIEIEYWGYYVAANGDVYIEDLEITQAT